MSASTPALERPVAKGPQTSRPETLPVPIKGWNTRDPISALDPRFGITVDNWIPRERDMELRQGGQYWTNETPSFAPKSFMSYISQSGVKQLFVTSGLGVYDITSSGAVPAASIAITSPLEWQFVNFANLAGTHLYAANGVQTLYYNGLAWTDVTGVSVPAITGVSTSALHGPMVHKKRIWFVQTNSMDVWYLPVDSIAGAAVKFPLGPNFSDGGSIIAQGTWTIDAGDGADDYAVFVTTEGQVAVYSGTDPVTDFALRGVYKIPKPLGRRCLTKFGGDLLILTEQGVFPLSKALLSSSVSRNSAVTDYISGSFRESSSQFFAASGWCMELFTEENLLLVNVPTQVGVSPITVQYVMNTTTGAWCRFLGMSAYDMIVFDKKFLYTGSSRVVLGLNGLTEPTGEPVVGEFLTAFNYFGRTVGQKHIKLIRPQVIVTQEIQMMMAVGADYNTAPEFQSTLVEALVGGIASIWDVDLWDAGFWAFNATNILEWKTIFSNVGFCLSIGLRVYSSESRVRCTAIDVVLEDGFVL